MKTCEQAPGLSVYQHGLDVANWYRGLWDYLNGVPTTYKFHIDEHDKALLQQLMPLALPPKDARMYQVYHDCGKPYCNEFDEQGRRHFPNHAELSYQYFLQAVADQRTADLIRYDMLCHTAKGEDIGLLLSLDDAPTLLISSWAELHSNAAALFGGFESDSFKIKRKKLRRIGNKLVSKMKEG